MYDMSEMNKALEWVGSPYRARSTEKWQGLVDRLAEVGASPKEFMAILRFHEKMDGPEKFVSNILCSDWAWHEFLESRAARMEENKLRSELQRARIFKILSQDKSDVAVLAASNVEDLMSVARYFLARSAGDIPLAARFCSAAAYELETAPELADCMRSWNLPDTETYLQELEYLKDD